MQLSSTGVWIQHVNLEILNQRTARIWKGVLVEVFHTHSPQHFLLAAVEEKMLG